MNKKWIITPRQRCDLEMLLSQGFAPLTGFLTRENYESVCQHMRLVTGELWPIPITLDVNDEFAATLQLPETIELYDVDNTLLAYMEVQDKWQPDKTVEANQVFGTDDLKHPAVHYLFCNAGGWYLGGNIQKVRDIPHFDFPELRHSPHALKQLFQLNHFPKVIGFQTRNPMHRAHMELTLRAAKEMDGHILIHPVVGLTKSEDVDYFTRVRCYQKILAHYPVGKATLSLLPLAMRMGGPREALWHALIRKNYGCTHFIIGRDHAGPGTNSAGKPFYDPYASQKLVAEFEQEIGITMLPFQEMLYVKERKIFCSADEIESHETPLTISGTDLRSALLHETAIPEWFSFPEIIDELRASYLPKYKKGFTIFFTGLSGAGKTVLSQALFAKLKTLGLKNMTILDSDVTRRVLANDLGFSKKDRDINIKRLGFVASEITKIGGIAICAAIAPYKESRSANRQLISQHGGYIEVYVSTSLVDCLHRDTKGLYAKALKGELPNLSGLNDPYEVPENPELNLDTGCLSLEECIQKLTDFLIHEGYIKTIKHKIHVANQTTFATRTIHIQEE
ncbi:MAG TPA: bifunctional sulfate adenylyltransferase/adenylylsulfate kinase [Gammaproteobacteria bacterium]|nr:bifunctional sulfate adenylyltransferase/adenylylsulfate kinase [Gammaproteobacteria bacterium]